MGEKQSVRLARRKLTVFLGIAVALGLLLWGRVLVISRMPRQAVAEEERTAVIEDGFEDARRE